MICHLCKADKKLIKAHIIPASFYDFDDQRDLRLVPSNPSKFVKKSRTGVYDTGILCRECDQFLNKEYDEPAFKSLQHGNVSPLIPKNPNKGKYYQDIDPTKMALFAISMLWRASISSHEFCERVDLGPFEKMFREMISQNEPIMIGLSGPESITILEYDDYDVPLSSPLRKPIDGINFYRFYFSRFCAIIQVDSRPTCPAFREVRLRTDQPTFTLLRTWDQSHERQIASKIALSRSDSIY